MTAQANQLLPLAANVARDFDNILGLPHAEIRLAYQEALTRAAWLFDPTKGDFLEYSAAAMRNAGITPSLDDVLKDIGN